MQRPTRYATRADKVESIITNRPLCAVRVRDCSLEAPVVQIPRGAFIQVCGKLRDPRFVDVFWQSARYAVFAADLGEPATP